jgi:hypothetical protein
MHAVVGANYPPWGAQMFEAGRLRADAAEGLGGGGGPDDPDDPVFPDEMEVDVLPVLPSCTTATSLLSRICLWATPPKTTARIEPRPPSHTSPRTSEATDIPFVVVGGGAV